MLFMLDRDGVLNHDSADFIKNPGELMMIEGSAKAVARLNQAGHFVALVTNQSGVGRGMFDEPMLERIHDKLRDELARFGGHLDAIFQCCDAPWAATDRRKPGPGMLREAMTRFRKGASECIMIGDSARDLEAASKAGVRRILVRTGNGAKTQAAGLDKEILPVSVYDSLESAIDSLLT